MNNTVGTLKADFKRGANPARGYLETGNSTSMTMQGIADKAVASKQAVGQALGNAYASASDSGLKIPVDVVAQQMAKPLQKALDLATGPGGTGDTSAIKNYIEQFGPTFERAAANGGFTPKELFDMKEAIAKNTNWSDPAQFSLKRVRQQQTGALSGILSKAVPETAGLNQHYQDLSKLARLTSSNSTYLQGRAYGYRCIGWGFGRTCIGWGCGGHCFRFSTIQDDFSDGALSRWKCPVRSRR
jgi:hypothetical protein